MEIILKIAIRNLVRHYRRTLITVFSIAFGLSVILWLQSILRASSENVIASISKAHIGHIQVVKQNYFKEKLIKETLENPVSKFENLLPPGSFWSERLNLSSLASSGEQSLPVMLIGVNPKKEKDLTTISSFINNGKYLEPEDPDDCTTRQAVIGLGLAKALNIDVGNKFVILSNASDGTLGNELLRVQGIYANNAPDFEKSMVFTTLGCVRKIGVLTGIHELTIRLPDSKGDLELSQKIQASLAPDLLATTWRQVMPRINGIVTYNEAAFILVSVMLFTVITLGIVNNVMVSVFERTKEFGVMLALGTAPWQVIIMVVLETVFMGLFASLIGIIIGAIAVKYHTTVGFDLKIFFGQKVVPIGDYAVDTLLYPKLALSAFVRPLSITMFFVLISAIYPAVLAARLKPIEAMR